MSALLDLVQELRNIARDAPMEKGTRNRLHAIAHGIELADKEVAPAHKSDELGLPVPTRYPPMPVTVQPPTPDDLRRAVAMRDYRDAMQAAAVPHEPLQVYDSNSWRRVGLVREYREVMMPTVARDGHPDIRGTDVLRAMVAAFNAMLVIPSCAADPRQAPTCTCSIGKYGSGKTTRPVDHGDHCPVYIAHCAAKGVS